MDRRFNKPRVFLSHSKKNVDFIEKLDNDLRKCQIDTWLDTVEIRHGKSWQDSIFEFGIPTCDAVIVYLTELSIQSLVVKKEMDVALLQNLADNNIAFLPYVSDENLRKSLRPDIQALQVPEWNSKNYELMLPRVVSEIWRSYLERTISSAIKEERLKRIETELALQKYKNQSDEVFSKSEYNEFEYILNSFNGTILFKLYGYIQNPSDTWKRDNFFEHDIALHLSTLVPLLSDVLEGQYYNQEQVCSYIYKDMLKRLTSLPLAQNSVLTQVRIPTFNYLTDEILTFGLLERFPTESVYVNEKTELTNKYYRFRFWLAYHRKLPEQLSIEFRS